MVYKPFNRVGQLVCGKGLSPAAGRSNHEVIKIADRIGQLSAGGGAVEALLVIILVGFIVLVITDMTGVTDVFPK